MRMPVDRRGSSRPQPSTPNQADYQERQRQQEAAASQRPTVQQVEYEERRRSAPTTVNQADYQARRQQGEDFLRRNPDLDFSPAAVAQREREAKRKDELNPYNYMARVTAAALADQSSAPGVFTSFADSVSQHESLKDYPTLLAASYKAGLTDSEVRTLVNFTEAHRAATAIANTVDPSRAEVIFSSMSGPMQVAVVDILKAAQENPDLVKGVEEASSWIGDLLSGALDKLLWLNEQGQHFGRAGLAARNEAISTDPSVSMADRGRAAFAYVSGGLIGSFDPKYWDATEKGKYDEKKISDLRKEYGSKPVEIILRANSMAQEEQPDVYGRLIAEYVNDPEAMGIIDDLMNKRNNATDLLKLTDLVDSAHMGNFGFLLTNPFTPDVLRGSELQNQTVAAVNVAATFAYDPTIALSKARAAYMFARFGVHKLAGGEAALEKAFKMRQVNRFFNTFGKDLSKVDGLKYADEATAMARLKRKYGSWLDEITIEEMRAFGVRSSDDALRYFKETDMMFAVLRGQAIRRPKYIPHANILADTRRKATGLRGISPKAKGASSTYGMAAWTRGSNVVDRQDQSARVADALVTRADEIGRAEGVIIDPKKRIAVTKAGGRRGLRMYGEFTGFTYSDKSLAARVDRFMRRLARMPNGAGGISIIDARDAKRVYDYARAFMTKYHANLIRQAFIDGNPATRIRIIQGLNRSAGFAKGIHLRDPENGMRMIDELSWGTRASDQYAATQTGIMGENLGAVAEAIDETSARYALPKARPTGDAAKDRMLQSLKLEWRDNIKRQNELRASLKETRSEIRVREVASELKSLRRDAVDIQREMRVVTQGTGEVARRTARAAARPNTPASQSAADQVTAGTAARVDAQAKQAAADLRSVNRQIAKLEKKAGPQSARLQELYRLKAQMQTESSASYFEGQALKAKVERIKQMSPDNIARFDPSNVNGRSYAIFPWQVSDRVAIPRWDVIEVSKARTSLLDQFMGLTQGSFAQRSVDLWTFGTLASPRFAVRNAIEDYLFYAATRGGVKDLQTGRIVSTSAREARGALQPALLGEKSRPALGIVNRNMRKRLGDHFAGQQGIIADFVQRLFSKNLDPKMVEDAQLALRRGNTKPMEDLTAYAYYRNRFSRIIPGTKEDRYLRDFVQVQGFRALDEVTDAARYMTDATLPGVSTAWKPTAGAKQATVYRSMYTGDYKDIALSADDQRVFERLYADIYRTVEDSRSIGKIVVAQLAAKLGKGGEAARAARTIKKVAEKVRTDQWYRQNMGILYETGMTEEQFASRFYYAVRNLFSGPDGRLNDDLLSRIVQKRTDANGNVFVSVAMKDGDKNRLFVDDLRQMDRLLLPESVIGREAVNIPMFDDMNLMDRGYKIMGEMNGRLSRENILMANYLDIRKQVAASGWEERLIAGGMKPEKARQHIARMSVDHAYERTMMFTDNPEIRTMLAWNVRNIARFYRATEDFYRRMLRVTKTNPEALWKAALTYDTIGHSGFVYKDQNGDKYFVYPGIPVIFDAVANHMGIAGSNQKGFGSPLIFGGKINMLTPSLDPNAWLPTFSGFLAAFPTKVVLDKFPAARWIEKRLLGEYGADGEPIQSLLPAPVLRALGAISKDERESQYSSAYKSAIQIATANGMAPDAATAGDSLSYESQRLQYEDEVGRIAAGVLWARFAFGFFAPASPQILSADVTEYARKLGVSGARPAYIQLMNQYDTPDEALAAWYKLNPKLMPYTISRTEDGPKVNRKSTLQPTKKTIEWLDANKALTAGFPTSSTFLAPQDGEYDPDALSMLESLGYKQPKSYKDFAAEVLTQEGVYVWSQTKKDYQEFMASTTDKQDRADARQKWKVKQDEIFRNYPGTSVRVNSGDRGTVAQDVLNQTRKMLDYIYEDGSPVEPSAESDVLSKMIATFDEGNTVISSIVGSTEVADAARRDARAKLRQKMNEYAASSVNADRFYQSVLDPLMED